MQQAGQQYALAGRELRYNEFLKRVCRQTSIPIEILHTAICKYAETHQMDGLIHEFSMPCGFYVIFSVRLLEWK